MHSRFQFGAREVLVARVLPETYATFNYVVRDGDRAVLIDAGAARPVFELLEAEGLRLVELLITHDHGDHTGGCRAILDRLGVQATSPAVESRSFETLETPCRSFATPGHMAVCKSYHFPELGIVFTGDTLINGACGRMMDGAAGEFFESLRAINALPDETLVFGGHDYLEENMRFALSVEPGNTAARERLARYASEPARALFVSLAEERATNPFLRAASVGAFAELRARKDRF